MTLSWKWGLEGSPSVSPPRCQKKYAITLSAISVTVTTGKRMVGMLSLSGNTLRGVLPRGGERAPARLRLRDVLVGVVARPHERPGGDVVEAERVGGVLEGLELVGVPEAHDGQVALGRPQVLADGEDLHALLAEGAERLDHLVVGLAEAHHQAGLRHDLVAAHLLRVAQHAQGALPARAAARDRVEPRDRLDVVVEDVGALGDHLRERHLLAAEVGGQHLDLAVRGLEADGADDADEGGRAVVGQVVAVDARDDRVAQAHLGDRARHAQRLERVVPGRLARLDVAEAAAPGAGVAEDHEGGGAALPALPDVGARRLLADRVQPLRADEVGQLAVLGPAGRRHLEPRRLAAAERLDLLAEHLADVHPARIGARAGDVEAGAPAPERTGPPRPSRSRSGVTRRCRRPNASQNAWAIRRRKQGRCSPWPVSFVTEVMRTPSSPHGTTHSNGWRSLSTLIAKPCVVTPRETWTPIEPILRSSTQTPVRPSRGPAAMPSSASAATIASSIVRR